MTPDQIADLISERFAIDRERLRVRRDVVQWSTAGGGSMAVYRNEEIVTEARSGGTDGHGDGSVYISLSLPGHRFDLIPWAVEHVSAIALQARAHGVP